MRFVFVVFLLALPVHGQDKQNKKELFDYASLEKTSQAIAVWRKAIIAERIKAEQTGNDIELMELKIRFQEEIDKHTGETVKWKLRFAKAVNGQVFLAEDYRFKGHAIRVQVSNGIGKAFGVFGDDDTQKIEPWMKQLKPGQMVNATGVISGMWPDTIVLSKVRISP